MTSIHTKQEEIILHLYQLTSHHYLLERCGKPRIPKLFIKILQLMLTSIHENPMRIFTYGVSTALLRMGLVVHEQVSLENEKERDEIEKRQLTILAGDYFSSLFYKTLANSNEIAGMHLLSKTASEICEVSMKHHIDGTFDPFSQELWTGGHLITALADFFHVQRHVIWCSLLSYFLHLDHNRSPEIEQEDAVNLIDSIDHLEVRAALNQMLLDREVTR